MIDMDGVLVDFARPALAAHGVALNDLSEYPFEDGWDIARACNTLRKSLGLEPITEHQFWAKLDNEFFWANLPPCNGMYKFLDEIKTIYPRTELCICSSAAQPGACMGKNQWLRKFLPDYPAILTLFPLDKVTRKPGGSSPKYRTAGPATMLIDDSSKMCKTFVDAGGSCILVPRPWNQFNWPKSPYDYVLRVLKTTKNVDNYTWNLDNKDPRR